MFYFLKYLLSFLTVVRVEKINSPDNPSLSVNLWNGKRMLDTHHANYSFGKLHTLFVRTFKKIHPEQKQIKKALILGYGGGSVAAILKEYFPDVSITGVESDPVVIETAKKYFRLNKQQYVKIVICDACQFVQDSVELYDLIAVDLYSDNVVPDKFGSDEFLTALRKITPKNGMVVFNRMMVNNVSADRVIEAIENFKKVFPSGYPLRIAENLMLIYNG